MKWLDRLFPPIKDPDYTCNGQDMALVTLIHTEYNYNVFRVIFSNGLRLQIREAHSEENPRGVASYNLAKLRGLFIDNIGHSYFMVYLPDNVEIVQEILIDKYTPSCHSI